MDQKQIDAFVNQYNTDLSIFQSSLVMSISSLIYSEYIHNFTERRNPTYRIFIPTTRNVGKFLEYGSTFDVAMNDHLVNMIDDKLKTFSLYMPYRNLDIFSIMHDDEFTHLLKNHFMPNAEKCIPAVIRMKFRLDQEDQHTFIEDHDKHLFNNNDFTYEAFPDYYEFIADQLITNILLRHSLVTKTQSKTSNMGIIIDDKSILVIKHDNALAQINLDKPVCANKNPLELVKFVSTTGITESNDNYIVDTHHTNQIELFKFE